MAKGLQLTSTNIRQFHLSVDDGVGNVRVLYDVLDDGDELVKSENWNVAFLDLPVQIRAALNNVLRLVSREVNNNAVAENSETWVDL
jgi:hypothetical protein